MLKLADLEKEYLVTCKFCAKPMPAWELFCPSCDEDQSSPEAADGASRSARLEWVAADTSETVVSGSIESTPSLPQEWESIAQPVATTAANEDIGFELGRVRPGSLWPDVVPVASAPMPVEVANPIGLGRVAIGAAALLVVLLLFALMHDTFVLRSNGERVAANAAPARNPSGRDDPPGAERAPGGPDAGQPKGVVALQAKDAADLPAHATVSRDEPLPDNRVTAAQALGLGEAAAAPAAMPLPPATTAVAMPASNAEDSRDKECSGAHAALALCQTR